MLPLTAEQNVIAIAKAKQYESEPCLWIRYIDNIILFAGKNLWYFMIYSLILVALLINYHDYAFVTFDIYKYICLLPVCYLS